LDKWTNFIVLFCIGLTSKFDTIPLLHPLQWFILFKYHVILDKEGMVSLSAFTLLKQLTHIDHAILEHSFISVQH
jgi:hypothetical protein